MPSQDLAQNKLTKVRPAALLRRLHTAVGAARALDIAAGVDHARLRRVAVAHPQHRGADSRPSSAAISSTVSKMPAASPPAVAAIAEKVVVAAPLTSTSAENSRTLAS